MGFCKFVDEGVSIDVFTQSKIYGPTKAPHWHADGPRKPALGLSIYSDIWTKSATSVDYNKVKHCGLLDGEGIKWGGGGRQCCGPGPHDHLEVEESKKRSDGSLWTVFFCLSVFLNVCEMVLAVNC